MSLDRQISVGYSLIINVSNEAHKNRNPATLDGYRVSAENEIMASLVESAPSATDAFIDARRLRAQSALLWEGCIDGAEIESEERGAEAREAKTSCLEAWDIAIGLLERMDSDWRSAALLRMEEAAAIAADWGDDWPEKELIEILSQSPKRGITVPDRSKF